MTDTPNHPILIVEDSNEDFEATIRAFKKAGLGNPVFRCENGDDALSYLYQRGKFAAEGAAPRPGIVLLDLNLPGTDGREVLSTVKKDAGLKKIPIIVLTTSRDEKDIEGCYRDGANSYIVKPVDMNGFLQAIQRLKDFWFEVVVYPKTP